MSQTKKSDKDHALDELVSQVERAHGQGAVMRLSDNPSEPIPVISTGSFALDQALGVGGYPRGRIIEIYGPESSGKTTLSLHAVAEVHKAGGLAAFIDAEHAFDLRYARALGVDMKRLLVSQPDHGEQALDIVEMLARSGEVDLIVVDSVAALVPKAEIEGDMGDSHMGLHARLMSQGMRKLGGTASRSSTTIIFINQLRQKIGVVFGNPETTTGGAALKFYASVRLDVRRIGKVEVGDTLVGNRTRVRVVKNKVAPPFNEAEFDVRWGIGIDPAADLLDTAIRLGAVEKNGSHLTLGGKSIGQGREKVREALMASAELASTLRNATYPRLPACMQPAPKKAA
jgi:recombination protein RecA